MAKVNFKRNVTDKRSAPLTLGALFTGLFGPTTPLVSGHESATARAAAPGWSAYQPKTLWQKLVENIRTGGEDPVYRQSAISSFAIHFFLIFGSTILALLPTTCNYDPPPGGNGPTGCDLTEPVHMTVKTPRPKIRLTLILNINSPIIFHLPSLDESPIAKILEKESQHEYETSGTSAQELVATASPGGLLGGPGNSRGPAGKGRGRSPGFPGGNGNGPIHFVRLEYADATWSDGNEPGYQADINFLAKFTQLTGIKTTHTSNSIPIYKLNQIPEGQAPPFVYITGRNDINPSSSDIKTLRTYVQSGGMIFGDAGSAQFDQAFRAMVAQIFPGESLIDIADDDSLYTYPNALPNGAPAVFHHGGARALGIKQRGRWVVFYHPGSLKDLWRTGGSGANPTVIENSYRLGVNIVYYAFVHYMEISRQKKANTL